MNNEAPISFNPYADDSIVGFIKTMAQQAVNMSQFCIPAIITKVINREQVVVKPAVNQYNAKWESVEWGEVKLPVHAYGMGNVFISIVPKVGDTGWVVAGDLDSSLFIKDKTHAQNQNTLDRHKYQFGFFLPDMISGYGDGISDEDAFVITNTNSDVRISINTNGQITIDAKSDLKINAETVNITGSSKVEINGTDWQNHTHGVGTLTTTATVGSSTIVGVLSGSTGGVE